MKLALLAVATLAIASPVEVKPRAEHRPRDPDNKLEQRQGWGGSGWVDWHGRDGKDICNLFFGTPFPDHQCSVGCWDKGYKYYDKSYGESWCCCWGWRW